MSKGIKIFFGAVIVIILLAALYLFYNLNPETQPIFPKCPFFVLTGYECPGCGTQRAIHQLLHLNIGAALKLNAFMVLAIPYVLLGVYMEYFGGKQRNVKLYRTFFGKYSALVVLIIIILYWILRNLPALFH